MRFSGLIPLFCLLALVSSAPSAEILEDRGLSEAEEVQAPVAGLIGKAVSPEARLGQPHQQASDVKTDSIVPEQEKVLAEEELKYCEACIAKALDVADGIYNNCADGVGPCEMPHVDSWNSLQVLVKGEDKAAVEINPAAEIELEQDMASLEHTLRRMRHELKVCVEDRAVCDKAEFQSKMASVNDLSVKVNKAVSLDQALNQRAATTTQQLLSLDESMKDKCAAG